MSTKKTYANNEITIDKQIKWWIETTYNQVAPSPWITIYSNGKLQPNKKPHSYGDPAFAIGFGIRYNDDGTQINQGLFLSRVRFKTPSDYIPGSKFTLTITLDTPKYKAGYKQSKGYIIPYDPNSNALKLNDAETDNPYYLGINRVLSPYNHRNHY
jgi:hypothetical protein